jgi:excisionase family DNA binding protein
VLVRYGAWGRLAPKFMPRAGDSMTMQLELCHALPTNLPEREYFVDADEAARFLKLDRRTVLQWARDGRIPAHPLDPRAVRKDWRFLLSELDSWLRGQVNSACRSRPASARIQ